MGKMTPMMQNYVNTKEEYKDCILFYRLGDFYEMFFEDAITCSQELELTLTGKDCGMEERAPMCGVPYHAVENYLNRLIAKGYKVAICEQVEDPKQAKGLVKREVVRIVTPGTNLNTDQFEDGRNNYLMALCLVQGSYGISAVDVTTGDYYLTEVTDMKKLTDQVNRFSPSEIVMDAQVEKNTELKTLVQNSGIAVSVLDVSYFERRACHSILKQHFHVANLDGLGLTDYPAGMIAAGAVLSYLYETQKNPLDHLTKIIPYECSCYMVIDSHTRRNLELMETLREKKKRGSLLWVLDQTKTAMGARALRLAIEQPLLSKNEIETRLDAVEELVSEAITREELREYLNPIFDLERLLGRVCYQTANPRDLVALADSLKMIPPIKVLLQGAKSELIRRLCEELDGLEDITELIHKAIVEEPPLAMKEGGIIRDGYHERVDELRLAKTDGKKWLSELEQKHREQTGIKNLKIKFNKVFGYYLEVTNSYKELAPADWTRRQTLANAERYTTDELKRLEETILGAEDKLGSLEYQLFSEIRDKVQENTVRIQKTAKAIGSLDYLAGLACVAERNQFVRPMMNEEGRLSIVKGRHPVVERMIANGQFVSNDTMLDLDENRICIITGPNMAGKSTYMRQTALIVLMAQIGSFVPASEADIGIVDRIFTRVGASDDLASGQSTFMVEMTEVANILRHATSNSLVVLDEIGRGTSTFDGLSIAWAVVEHINDHIGAKTLFATHYHELTTLEGKLSHVKNYCVLVKESGDDVVFLRQIIRGGADRSFGIQVARLAGVPEGVLGRAKEIADKLVSQQGGQTIRQVIEAEISGQQEALAEEKERIENREVEIKPAAGQLSFFIREPGQANENLSKQELARKQVADALLGLDLFRMTPIDAMNKLASLQKKLKKSEE